MLLSRLSVAVLILTSLFFPSTYHMIMSLDDLPRINKKKRSSISDLNELFDELECMITNKFQSQFRYFQDMVKEEVGKLSSQTG